MYMNEYCQGRSQKNHAADIDPLVNLCLFAVEQRPASCNSLRNVPTFIHAGTDEEIA